MLSPIVPQIIEGEIQSFVVIGRRHGGIVAIQKAVKFDFSHLLILQG